MTGDSGRIFSVYSFVAIAVLIACRAPGAESVVPVKSKTGSNGSKSELRLQKPTVVQNNKEKKNDGDHDERYVPEMIQYAHDLLDDFRFKCPDCDAFAAGDGVIPDADQNSVQKVCQRAWSDFYSKEEIEIRVAFGFLDGDFQKESDDGFFRKVLIEQLTRPCVRALPECAGAISEGNRDICESNVRACGFTRSPEDDDVLTREIIGPTNRRHKVSIRLSPTFGKNPTVKTFEKVETFFFDGLKTADAVIYMGHAQKGAGPRFRPVLRRADDRTDWNHPEYKKRPGYNRMLESLRSASKPAKIVGLLACEADYYFRRGLAEAAPRSGRILASAADTEQSLFTRAYISIDSILWARCQTGFNGSLNVMKDFNEKLVRPVYFEQFFDSHKIK